MCFHDNLSLSQVLVSQPRPVVQAVRLRALTRAVNRTRQLRRPQDPVTLEFNLDYEFLPKDFVVEDIKIQGARHIVMATPRMLQLLGRVKTW